MPQSTFIHYPLSDFKVTSTCSCMYCSTSYFQLSESVLVSCDYSNELPQNCWLKATKMYFSIVLEAKSLKLVLLGQNQCQEVILALEVLLMNLLVPCLFQLPATTGILHLSPSHSNPVSVVVFSPPHFYTRTLAFTFSHTDTAVGFKGHQDNLE